jgi:magnesium transporter
MDFFTITPEGAVLSPNAPTQLPADGFIWCDCLKDEARTWVEPVRQLTGITVFEDHLIDAENPNHPSYFDSTSRYEMIVFRGLVPPPATPQEVLRVQTRPSVYFVFPGCLVTVRAADSRQIPLLRERLLAAAGHHQRLPAGPEELMLRILNGQVDRYLDLRQPLTDQLERWQRELLDPRRVFSDWLRVLQARAEARKLEQLCEEQLDAIQEWRDERLEHFAAGASLPPSALPALNDALQVRANDVVEHINRVLSHARRLESSVESAVQLHFSATAHRTNEIVRTLTTITAIFMPLTLITGIFGMNFDAIPGLHSPLGFYLTMAGMLLIALLLLAWFKARRYLSGGEARRRRQRPPRA